MKEKLEKIVNSDELLHRLVYLKDRWQDEGKYESFEAYEDAMKVKLTSLAIKGLEFVKGTKRPFGFQGVLDGKKIAVFVKSSGRMCWLAVKVYRVSYQ